jgi:hypothetical protein
MERQGYDISRITYLGFTCEMHGELEKLRGSVITCLLKGGSVWIKV